MFAVDSHKLVEKVKEVVSGRQLVHAVILSVFALVGIAATAGFLYAAVECEITRDKETGVKRWHCENGRAAKVLAGGDKATIGALAAKVGVVAVVMCTVFFTSGIALWVSLRRCSNNGKFMESEVQILTPPPPGGESKQVASMTKKSDIAEKEEQKQLTEHEMV